MLLQKERNLDEIRNSIIYAQTIQNGLLPKQRHFEKFFQNHFILYKPQQNLSGDFYWLTQKNDTTYFVLADCTGHGVSGAMLSVLGISLLNYLIQKDFNNLGELLTELDRKWIETFKNEQNDNDFNNDWMEISIVAINHLSKNIQYACAGSEFCMLQNNQLHILKGDKFPIGGWQINAKRQYNHYNLELEDNISLYLHSDGFKDQFDSTNKKKFGRKRLHHLINSSSNLHFSDQKEMIEFVFSSWKEEVEQTDDVTLVGLKIS